jgi:hypothetical protein
LRADSLAPSRSVANSTGDDLINAMAWSIGALTALSNAEVSLEDRAAAA